MTAVDINHKGGRTLGYRVASDTGSFAYLPDHAPSQGIAPEVWDLIDGVDVLLHDAQFTEAERPLSDLYGHATVEETVVIAAKAGVGKLVLFHHSPVRTDDQLDRILDLVAHRPSPSWLLARACGSPSAADPRPRSTVQSVRAIVQDRYGDIDALDVQEVERPAPAEDEVLVRVRAASVHPDVWHVVAGHPWALRLMGSGIRRRRTGCPAPTWPGSSSRSEPR